MSSEERKNAKEKMVEALLALLRIKPFDRISVAELCRIAKVNRTTFYLYFDSMFDLLSEVERYAAKSLVETLPPSRKREDDYLKEEYIIPYLQFVKKTPNLFRAYMSHAKILGFEQTYERILRDVAIPRSGGRSDKEIDYISSFIIGGIASLVRKWVDKGFQESPEEIAKLILTCVKNK